MKLIGLFLIFQTIFVSLPTVSALQNVVHFQTVSRAVSNSGEFVVILKKCDQLQVDLWRNDFHSCFIKRKYDDGGENLESIVDRILTHAEACIETSDKECRPSFNGFKEILRSVLEQIKDYCSMYLESIFSGREKIKDLKCVEETLNLTTFENCFSGIPAALNKTDYEVNRSVKEGVNCTNEENIECSKEARTSLNRVIRTIFGIEQPAEEDAMPEKPLPPPPKLWYQYVTDPIVAAWKAVKNFFSNMFG